MQNRFLEFKKQILNFQKDKGKKKERYKTSSSACSELVSYECAVSKEFQLALKEEESEEEIIDDIPTAPTLGDFVVEESTENDNKETDESTSRSFREEFIEGAIEEEDIDFEEDDMVPWTSRFEASAPVSDFTASFIQREPEPLAQYPSLSGLRLTEESTHPAGTNSRFVTKPKAFTAEEMKSIYCCKELNNVRQFETYFIQHNLHFSYENEPLFLLLQAYSLLRGKLKMNLIDLKKFQAKFKRSSEKIWCSREVTEKFEAICADNVLMQISESFE